jgi:methanogen homoaconitase small subunit
LKRRQIGAILANSFARIFFRNAVNLGIPLYVAPEIVTGIAEGAQVELDLVKGVLQMGERMFGLPPLSEFAQLIIAAGGIVPYVRAHGRFPGE